MAACLRSLRLISLARNSSTAELVLDVLWQSSQALKGPLYFLAASTVYFGIVARSTVDEMYPRCDSALSMPRPPLRSRLQVFYTEMLMGGPDAAGFDTLGNAIWYSWVTFSTVRRSPSSPTRRHGPWLRAMPAR